MSAPLRVAILSHGHPELSAGGAENASYALFRLLKREEGFAPTYIARAKPAELGHSAPFGLFRGRPDEILWAPPKMDGFRMTSAEPGRLRQQAEELFARVAPDLLHMHHYAGLGADIVRIASAELGIPVIVTLHEFLAICHNSGQMLTTGGALCRASSPADCSRCYPTISSGKFFLRREMLKEMLGHAAAFICSSAFLAERYAAWGIAAERMQVVENPLVPPPAACATPSRTPGARLRLGYFGQLTPFKGIDLLLDAMALLEEDLRKRVRLVMFGLDRVHFGAWAASHIDPRMASVSECVESTGPYRNDDVARLMRSVDWIVVPSLWWENSPLVIQEARMAGVPILCADIGGMREKVRPGIDGAHFRAGDRASLADHIAAIVEGSLSLTPEPLTDQHREPLARTIACYRAVLASRCGATETETPAIAAAP